uniref:Uncharacterized protein n=1 Tax=Knipowitschia caucasica TaxID=637954 RepID=A0AAV2MI79_KNICA
MIDTSYAGGGTHVESRGLTAVSHQQGGGIMAPEGRAEPITVQLHMNCSSQLKGRSPSPRPGADPDVGCVSAGPTHTRAHRLTHTPRARAAARSNSSVKEERRRPRNTATHGTYGTYGTHGDRTGTYGTHGHARGHTGPHGTSGTRTILELQLFLAQGGRSCSVAGNGHKTTADWWMMLQ